MKKFFFLLLFFYSLDTHSKDFCIINNILSIKQNEIRCKNNQILTGFLTFKSDISNLFQDLETIATETKLEEKKKRGYVEPSVSDLSNLFEGLEEASRQAKELSSDWVSSYRT